MTVDAFIERWGASGASEHGNATLFLSELCDLLDVGRPDPAGPDTRTNAYVFERRVDYPDQSDREHGYIDLYKRGCFVLEAKQGRDVPTETEGERLGVEEPARRYSTARRDRREWERAMQRAENQAYRYARGLPDAEQEVGFGDMSIIEAFNEQCERHPSRRVFIWAINTHLAGYDRAPQIWCMA